MKSALKIGLFVVLMLSAFRAEAQQNIQSCVPGMRVVTKDGAHGNAGMGTLYGWARWNTEVGRQDGRLGRLSLSAHGFKKNGLREIQH